MKRCPIISSKNSEIFNLTLMSQILNVELMNYFLITKYIFYIYMIFSKIALNFDFHHF